MGQREVIAVLRKAKKDLTVVEIVKRGNMSIGSVMHCMPKLTHAKEVTRTRRGNKYDPYHYKIYRKK